MNCFLFGAVVVLALHLAEGQDENHSTPFSAPLPQCQSAADGGDCYPSNEEQLPVGLINQGATCYMNSLLQTMFHIASLRRRVYQIPTVEPLTELGKAVFALQGVFWDLQLSDTSVSTKQLTESFGWAPEDSQAHGDVQEFCHWFWNFLEEQMKDTTITELFQGTFRSFIKCHNVDDNSSSDETFLDLSLNVKGCANVMASLRQYVEVETLKGENQYRSEEHGLQDAEKGVQFVHFPPVLCLHLKRYEYEPKLDKMVKLNDRFEFAAELDLREFKDHSVSAEASLAPGAAETDEQYVLHSVLMHCDKEIRSGLSHIRVPHYYAFVREQCGRWHKFDDAHVTFEEPETVFEAGFGGNGPIKGSAYMLVYVRRSDAASLMAPAVRNVVPVELRNVELVVFAELEVTQKMELSFSASQVFKEDKLATLKKVMDWANQEFGIPPEHQDWYRKSTRNNRTIRPNKRLELGESSTVMSWLSPKHASSMRLFLRSKANDAPATLLETGENDPVWPLEKDEDTVMLLLKRFDPLTPQLSFVGSVVLQANALASALLKHFGIYQNEDEKAELRLFEERCAEKGHVFQLDSKKTLKNLGLICGDIVVFSVADYTSVLNYYTSLRQG